MDASFLNYFMRYENGVIHDPWASGHTPKYYYLGYYYISLPLKLVGFSAGLAYPLAIITFYTLFLRSIYGLSQLFTVNATTSAIIALSVGLLSNIKSFLLWFMDHPYDFGGIWKSTRVFSHNFFAEYPIWSFLFADLHPHFMSYPFVTVFLVIVFHHLQNRDDFTCAEFTVSLILIGFLFGNFLGLNAWDFCLLALVSVVLFLISLRPKSLMDYGVLLAPVLGILFFLPVYFEITGGNPLVFELRRGYHGSWWELFNHHGQWLLILLFSSIYHAFKLVYSKRELSLLLVSLPLIFFNRGPQGYLFFYIWCFYIHYQQKSKLLHYSSYLILGAGALTLFIENIKFMSVMNTLFKGYTLVTLILSLACALIIIELIYLWRTSLKDKIKVSYISTLYTVTLLLVISASCIGSYYNLRAFSNLNLANGDRPQLDGLHFLKKANSGAWDVIDWVNKNVDGPKVILERYGKDFDHKTAVVSSSTGLNSYLNWRNHIRLRGVDNKEYYKRKLLIDNIYSTTDAFLAYAILKKIGVDYILVSPHEREHYEDNALKKFTKYDELFTLKISSRGWLLYELKGN